MIHYYSLFLILINQLVLLIIAIGTNLANKLKTPSCTNSDHLPPAAQVKPVESPATYALGALDRVRCTKINCLYLGKRQYFTNLNSEGPFGDDFPIKTMIPGLGEQ